MNINPFDLMKNAKVIQDQLGKLQEELSSVSVTGSSGGGIVSITLNGQFEITGITLDSIAVDPRDIPMLQDLIVAAHTDAMEKLREEIKRRAGGFAGMIPGFPAV